MERYEAYKDSGVEWVGEIPEGWAVLRLKSLLSSVPHALADGPFGSDMKSEEYQDSGVPITQLNNIKEGIHKDDAFKYVTEEKAATLSSHFIYPGELLMAKMMPAGRTCIASAAFPKYLLSSDSIRIVPVDEIDRRFLCYAANAYANIEAELLSTGTTRVRINLGIVRNMQFAIPPLNNQRAIADYLDTKTAEIDALVADCEREVGLLREYRKAVISEAVTKGLDPDAPMKDSGVEWIGEIPAHWDAGKLLRHARLESGHTPSKLHPEWWVEEECTIPWVTTQDVHRFRDGRITSIDDSELHVSQIGLDNSSARLLPAGTVALSRTASVGFSIVLSVPMASSQDFADWVPDEQLDSFYLLYSLRSMEKVFKQLQMGSTHKTIYMPDIMKLTVAYPPIEEQRKIAAFLDTKTDEIDSLIEAKEQMADKLREYRKSLISEAVTGKFKVPGV